MSAKAPHLFGAVGGRDVYAVELTSARGMRARVLTLGAALHSLTAPDRQGRWDDVVLGYDNAAAYASNAYFMGACVGRFANRIAGGRFELGGRRIALARNDGANTLHGGANGFHRASWRIDALTPSSVRMALLSPDGDEGFPGALFVTATYALRDEADTLDLILEARTDAPTIVSLSSHAYFNLRGAAAGGDIQDHQLTIEADAFTPIDATLIPTGEIRPVSGLFDFRTPRRIGDGLAAAPDEQMRLGGGYDHNFVLRGGRTQAPRRAARLEDPYSGRVLEMHSTEPGLQFYAGGFLDGGGPLGKGGQAYARHAGLCLEPQAFPDAPNQPHFLSARLDPGGCYRHHISFAFSTDGGG